MEYNDDSNTDLQFFADFLPQMVWITTPDGTHEYFNRQWYRYTGTKQGSTDGDMWINILHPDDVERTVSVWRHSLETGEPYEIEYRFKEAKSGKYRWFVGRALPRRQNGKIVKWYGTCTDIHDKKVSQQELESKVTERTKELEASNRELQDFAYVASHDLQEPLRKIQAFGNLLASETDGELGEASEYLRRMQSAASRMSVLIEDLLAFSRVSTKTNRPGLVDLNTVVTEVIDDLEARIDETKGSVVIKNKLPEVVADKTHMRQLFQNLIANALKFHKPESAPVVTITASNKPQAFEISVSDNGIGFDSKYEDKIFSVFGRLHGRDAYDGTGIGLAVCRKIAQRYGGEIAVESAEGEGATFTVTLPIKGEIDG